VSAEAEGKVQANISIRRKRSTPNSSRKKARMSAELAAGSPSECVILKQSDSEEGAPKQAMTLDPPLVPTLLPADNPSGGQEDAFYLDIERGVAFSRSDFVRVIEKSLADLGYSRAVAALQEVYCTVIHTNPQASSFVMRSLIPPEALRVEPPPTAS